MALNTIDISGISTNLSLNQRLLSDVLNLKVNAKNGLGKDVTFNYRTTQKYLYDSYNNGNGVADHQTSTVNTVADTFEHENFRTTNSTYVPNTTPPAKRNENAELQNGEALVYNGRLMHPKTMPTIAGNVIPAQTNNVDFSNYNNVAYYYRWFRKTGSPSNTIELDLLTSDFAAGWFGQISEENTKWTIAVQAKNGTWLDAVKSSTLSGGAGYGTLLSENGATGTTKTCRIAWTVEGAGAFNTPLTDEYFLLRIGIPPTDTTRYIETITIKKVG